MSAAKYYALSGNTMSRIGKQVITAPAGTELSLIEGVLTVKGPRGVVSREFRDDIVISINGQEVTLKPLREDDLFLRALWGTYASHIANMVEGVTNGFTRKLILEGIGYKVSLEGKNLLFALGFSHPVSVPVPDTLKVTANKNEIIITGADKEEVGQFAARLRQMKKPEPYKGKGLRYDGEVIRRKQGKKVVS